MVAAGAPAAAVPTTVAVATTGTAARAARAAGRVGGLDGEALAHHVVDVVDRGVLQDRGGLRVDDEGQRPDLHDRVLVRDLVQAHAEAAVRKLLGERGGLDGRGGGCWRGRCGCGSGRSRRCAAPHCGMR